MKRKISLLLVLSLFAGLLSGCIFNSLSIEEDILNQLAGGYLYTSLVRGNTKAERDILLARTKAVDLLIKQVEIAAKESFELIDTFVEYEDNLVKYIDKCEPDSSDVNTLRTIAETMIINRIRLDAMESEISSYIKMKTSDPAADTVIKTYLSSALCELVEFQYDYINTLLQFTPDISRILRYTNERQADRLDESAGSIYSKKIFPAVYDANAEFEKSALMHSYLISGDYYYSIYSIESAYENIQATDAAPGDLAAYISDLRNSIREPSVLKDVPDDEAGAGFSFLRSVSAEGSEEWDAHSITRAALPLYNMLKKIERDKDLSKYRHVPENAASLPKLPETPVIAISTSADAGHMSAAVRDAASKRLAAIGMIETGQGLINTIMMFSSTESKYTKILDQVTGLITDGKGSMSEEKRLRAVELIKTNINDLIGENKEQFVNKLTSESAERIYDTFMDWKKNIKNLEDHDFTINDLRTLLGNLGIEVNAPEPAGESQPPGDDNPSQEPSASTLPQDVSSDDEYGYPRIKLGYDALMQINLQEDNEVLLSSIIGWSDPLDYSSYKKKTTYDDNGKLTREYYVYEPGSGEGAPIGWDIEYRENRTDYTYRFPVGIDRSLVAYRYTTGGYDLFSSFTLSYNDLGRNITVSFADPGDAHYDKYKIRNISESTDGVKDGLQANWNSAWDTYSIWDKGKEQYSCYYKDGYLHTERSYTHDGDDVYAYIRSYREDGGLVSEQNLLNGTQHGVTRLFYENGNLKKQYTYSEGLENGTCTDYYENGQVRVMAEYEDKLKHGEYKSYYDNVSHQVRQTGLYHENERNGIWTWYEEDGSVDEEIEYKDGVKDGKYSNPGSRYGTYKDGEEHGEWYYGDTLEDWTIMEYYEDGVRIWKQIRSTGERTYYNEDGSVDRTENVED